MNLEHLEIPENKEIAKVNVAGMSKGQRNQ